jgi:FkbM family methyltransferase
VRATSGLDRSILRGCIGVPRSDAVGQGIVFSVGRGGRALNGIKPDLERERGRLRSEIARVYKRFRERRLKAVDTVEPSDSEGRSSASWMADAIAKRTDLQPDACVFRHLRREDGTILDIGAHWGYTALAMRLTGTDCQVVSIEASEGHRECLDELRRWDADYDYLIQALGEDETVHELYTPVVNGQHITGLTNVDGKLLDDEHGDFLATLVGKHIPVARKYKVQLACLRVPLRPLDKVVNERPFRFPFDRIAAVKLDVEGYEMQVLRGAHAAIARDRPLIMMEMEGGNRSRQMVELMDALGYLYGDRQGDQVRLHADRSRELNGYWVHRDRVGEYRTRGLVAA